MQLTLDKNVADRIVWMAEEGKSNSMIARKLGMDVRDVEFTLRAFLPVDPRIVQPTPKKGVRRVTGASQRIWFDEIRPGDKIRVTYVTQESNGWYGGTGRGITRSIASVAALRAFDKVWLNADGHPIAHRDWKDMWIYRVPV
ncbi:hypothetical protein SEA_ATUIN_242 [Arthrobacter phage Atuin]|nr:hypothetical protein SEA_ATUIN_41 [Arthrobacter phage Atuin]